MNLYVAIPGKQQGNTKAIWDYLDKLDKIEPIGMIYSSHSNAATDWAIERDRDFMALDLWMILKAAKQHIHGVVITNNFTSDDSFFNTGIVFNMNDAEDDDVSSY